MHEFTEDQLSGMRASQEAHMLDTCILQTYSGAVDSFGQMIPTFTDATTAIRCGLDMKPGAERHGPQYTSLEWDATLRLPISTTITARDRIKITHRYGEALTTALIFDIVGPIQRGPSGIRLLLRRVET